MKKPRDPGARKGEGKPLPKPRRVKAKAPCEPLSADLSLDASGPTPAALSVGDETTTPKLKKWPLPSHEVCLPKGKLCPACTLMAKLIRFLLKLKGWTLDELAQVTHMDRGYLFRLLHKDEINPGLDTMQRLADAFDCNLQRLMELMGRMACLTASIVPFWEEACCF